MRSTKCSYIATSDRYGKSVSPAFASIINTTPPITDGDLYFSTIYIYSDVELSDIIFSFTVGTLSGSEEEIWQSAFSSYLTEYID